MINTSATTTKTPQTLAPNVPKVLPRPQKTANKKRKQKYKKIKNL